MKATLYRMDGSQVEVTPENGADFSLREMQEAVGGYIDIQELPKDNMLMILNDEGKLTGLQKNEAATEIWKRNYPIAEYPVNNDELIVGNVIVCDRSLVR